QKGYLVAIPTRIGYGATGGPDVEDSGGEEVCARRNYDPGTLASTTQVMKVIDHLRQRADLQPNGGLLVGQSYGGFVSIAVSAQRPAGFVAAINFAGGNGGDTKLHPGEPCSAHELKRLYAEFGKTSRMPTLWIYTANDQFFSPKNSNAWFEAFKASGGIGEFRMLPPHGANGHRLFYEAPEAWQPIVVDFLVRQKALPTAHYLIQ